MKQYGHIKLPRSIKRIEGRNKGAKQTLLLHICLDAEYCVVEHPTHGRIERGEVVTSKRQLCKETGLSLSQVRCALSNLVAEGYITVEATARYSKITVIWDDYVQLRDNNIMLNNIASSTVSSTQSSKAETPATAEDSASYNDCEKKVAKQVAKQVAHEVANIVINNKENNNTHTENIYPVKDLKAQAHARDTHAHTYTQRTPHPADAQVVELLEWMTRQTPELMTMKQPFSNAELRQIVEEYTMDELQTILREMWSNGVPWRKLSAAVEFRKYARAHNQFRERFATEQQPTEKLYTYDEMADYVWKNRVPQDRYFQMVKHNGKMMYRKIG